MRTKRCEIIPEQCIACGLCALYAPDIFDYDEEGIVLFKQENLVFKIPDDFVNLFRKLVKSIFELLFKIGWVKLSINR